MDWRIKVAALLLILAGACSALPGCVTVCYDRGPGYERVCKEAV